MEQKPKIVFLYTELAAYFLACVKALVKQTGAEVHIVRWPLNKEAPFDFADKIDSIKFYNRNEYQKEKLHQLVASINPDLIYCSGWMDKGYVAVCKKFRKRIPVVGGLDTQWTGDFKQKLLSFLSPFTVKKFFSHVWVAGEPQRKYAKQLKFDDAHILEGVYSADVHFFSSYYNELRNEKAKGFPKKFIYVGRYLEFKGIFEMWDAFDELSVEFPNDWELWCLGTGDLWDKRMEHPRIKHFGFVQPDEMKQFLLDTGVFILPSKFEPWAVVVHEFCAAGFPILCSDKVGAATRFVKNGENGFIFKSGDKNEIKEAMKKMMFLNAGELIRMGDNSHRLAQTLTPEIWAEQLISVLKVGNK